MDRQAIPDRLGAKGPGLKKKYGRIEVIGEATKDLPDDVRARRSGIEWKKIAGMRDWISDVNDRVDDDIVWDAVETGVPELLRILRVFKDQEQA